MPTERPYFTGLIKRVDTSLRNGGGLRTSLDQARRGSRHLRALVHNINPDRELLYRIGSAGVVLATLVTYETIRHQFHLEARLPDLTSAMTSIFPIACLEKTDYEVNSDPPEIKGIVKDPDSGDTLVAIELKRADGTSTQSIHRIKGKEILGKGAREVDK